MTVTTLEVVLAWPRCASPQQEMAGDRGLSIGGSGPIGLSQDPRPDICQRLIIRAGISAKVRPSKQQRRDHGQPLADHHHRGRLYFRDAVGVGRVNIWFLRRNGMA